MKTEDKSQIVLPSHPPIFSKLRKGLSDDGMKYCLHESASAYSRRYDRWIHIDAGTLSDGATGAKDLLSSWSWWFHDELCSNCCWSNGSPCSAKQASQVVSDILDDEGRDIRRWTWKFCTYWFGSRKIKKRVGWTL
jgi:hypothetical protein